VPQLIALAVAGTVVYAGYKWLMKHNERSAVKARSKPQGRQEPRDLGELYWDEAAQAYRPRRRD